MEPQINCTQDNQDDAGQTTIDQFKTTVRAASAIFAWPGSVYMPLLLLHLLLLSRFSRVQLCATP